MTRVARAEDYFAQGCGRCARFATPDCSTRAWLPGLLALRRLCLAAGLDETAKWGHPTYVHAGRNVAILGAFRDGFRLSLFEAALLSDPEGALERQGPNARAADCLRFRRSGEVAEREATIRALLAQARDLAARGLRAPGPAGAPDLPEELLAALDADPTLAEAFHALTPGRRRSHALAVAGAKRAGTRAARVEALRPLILAGRGALGR